MYVQLLYKILNYSYKKTNVNLFNTYIISLKS